MIPRTYSVAEVAKLAGVSSSLIRIWEERYQWPQPKRDPVNNYRIYSEAQAQDVIRVAAAVKAGHLIGTLICDGVACNPRPKAEQPSEAETIAELRRRIALLCEVANQDVGAYFSDRGRIARQQAIILARMPVVKIATKA